MNNPDVTGFFDEATNTISYVAADSSTKKCAVIDSLLDYDASSGRTATNSADKLITYIKDNNYEVEWIIDTHVHADHLSAAPYIKSKLGGITAIGEKISSVQRVFSEVFNTEKAFHTDGSQFDHLFSDGEVYKVGNIEAHALHTPGHTPACMSHMIGDAIFVGDTLFMPDYGTARCDFPGGDAGMLYDSIQKIFTLGDEKRIFLCHDYQTSHRDYHIWETNIGKQKQSNIHAKVGTSRNDFIKMRTARDASLDMPKLILPSVQVNIRAGEMPPPEDNGKRYIKIPIDEF